MSINYIGVGTATPTNVRNAKPIPALIVRGDNSDELRTIVEEAIGNAISMRMRRIHPIRIQYPHQPPTKDAKAQVMPAHGYDDKTHRRFYSQIEGYLRSSMQPQ